MKRVLITGATDGIGKAIATLLDEKAYELILFGRSKDKMEALKLKHVIASFCFDMTCEDDLQNALKQVNDLGGVDVLINNAGANIKKDAVLDINLSDFKNMLSLNTIVPLMCMQALCPKMIEKKEGLVINVLSTCCLYHNKGNGAYTASKKAFEGISKTLVKEVKDKGIKVMDVYPGGVNTHFRSVEKPEYLKAETVAKHIIYAIENNDDGMIQDMIIRPVCEDNYC